MARTPKETPNGQTTRNASLPSGPAACPKLGETSNITAGSAISQRQGGPRVAIFPHYAPPFWQISSLSPIKYDQKAVKEAEDCLIYSRRKTLSEAAPTLERLRGLGFDEEKLQEIGTLTPERREYYFRRAYLVKKILRAWRRGNKKIDLSAIPIDEQCGNVDNDLILVHFGALKHHDLLELYGAGKDTLEFIGGGRGLKRPDMINTLEDVMALRLFQPVCEKPVLEMLREFLGVIDQYKSTGSHSCTISNMKEATWMRLKTFVDCAW